MKITWTVSEIAASETTVNEKLLFDGTLDVSRLEGTDVELLSNSSLINSAEVINESFMLPQGSEHSDVALYDTSFNLGNKSLSENSK